MSHKIVAISDATVSSPDPTCTTTETATIKQQITLLEMESVKIDAMLNATQASLQGNLWPTLIMQCVNIEFVFNRSTFTLHLHFQLQLEPQHQQQRWQQQRLCHQIQMQEQEQEQEVQGEQPQQHQHQQQHQCYQQPQQPCPLVTAAGLLMVRAATSLSQPRWTSIRSIFIFVYFVSLFQKTWDDASSDCSCTNKARLVDIKTKAENDFIKKLTNGVSGKGRCEGNQMIIVPCLASVWLGARDNTTEGTWTWSSDSSTLSSIAFNKWTGAKTPTTGINVFLLSNENIHNFFIRLHQELCRADNCRRVGWREVQHSQVIMSPEATLSIWHYLYRGYVCKKPDKTQTALPTVTCPVKQLCDAGWVSWGTSCYMMSASATTVLHTLTL